ncbi:hypothetical protein N0V94_005842 [Neodidymelliopsis sp. IMI 364377]|nr:hypothetical protein N0V94_005842 [Neodidymelliopsis sp. IMI 364377]
MYIQPGEKIGICGRTGSGKSSMLLTILQMIHTLNGTLTIDGINLSGIQPNTVRSNLITIPQDAAPLPGTVRFNVDPSSSFDTDAPIEDALKLVGLWTLVRTRGGVHAEMSALRLSSGQSQLFALARAALLLQSRRGKNGNQSSTVLLLDEVTANLDAKTEARMMEVLNGETFRGLTVLAVAHRLKTIVAMDRIVVLDKGRVMECGTPEELLEMEGSLFRRMYESLA